jgi:hypothetical protein
VHLIHFFAHNKLKKNDDSHHPLRIILFAALASVVTVTPLGCSVCGDGQNFGNPYTIFSFPGRYPDAAVTCGDLEEAGRKGQIPLDQCGFLPPIIAAICKCGPDGSPVAPPTGAYARQLAEDDTKDTQVASTTSDPVAPSPSSACQEITPEGGCSVCGLGSCITNQDAIVVLPNQRSISCSDLQEESYNGLISLDQCPIFPQEIGGLCECQPGGKLTTRPSISPTSPSQAPSTRVPPGGACSDIPLEGGCSICGTGSCITMPDAIFAPPGQPSISCSDLQDAGFSGQIPLEFCPSIPPLIVVCECRAFVPTLGAIKTPTTRSPIAPVVPCSAAPTTPSPRILQ